MLGAREAAYGVAAMEESLNGCPVCGSAERKLLYSRMPDRAFRAVPGEWDLKRCVGCGAAYLDPPPSERILAEAYAGYCTHIVPTVEQPPEGAVATVRRALRNGLINARYGYELKPATRLDASCSRQCRGFAARQSARFVTCRSASGPPDVGCGSGNFVAHAQAVGWHATGIDIDEQALEAGRVAGYDLRAETIEQHSEGDYDAITLGHVIEHVHDPVRVLAGLLASG